MFDSFNVSAVLPLETYPYPDPLNWNLTEIALHKPILNSGIKKILLINNILFLWLPMTHASISFPLITWTGRNQIFSQN